MTVVAGSVSVEPSTHAKIWFTGFEDGASVTDGVGGVVAKIGRPGVGVVRNFRYVRPPCGTTACVVGGTGRVENLGCAEWLAVFGRNGVGIGGTVPGTAEMEEGLVLGDAAALALGA